MTNLRLLVLLVLLTCVFSTTQTLRVMAQAQTYHVSSTNPAAADSNPGTQAQPWRTLARVQQVIATLRAGDQVLFERGGVYSGTLDLNNVSGALGNPIIFAAYGTGAEPIINGLETLTNWTALGSSRWEATCSGCGTAINHLLINGQTQRIARYPNIDEGDEGYLYIDSASGRTAITDDVLAGGPNWVGGELVTRSIAWILDRMRIQTQVGSTLTTANPANYDLLPGWGYFIQNHPAALDRQGEWLYNSTTNKVTLYSTTNPASSRVQVTTVDTLWRMVNVRYIELRDVALHGGDEFTLLIDTCTSVKLERVQLLYGGGEALRTGGCSALEIGNSRAAWALNFGLRISDCQNCRIHHSVIEQIAMFAGMGKSGDGQYNGVVLNGSNSIFEYNTVRYTGYLGVRVEGANIIRYNVVSYFNSVKVDGGGIYCWESNGSSIIGNVVLHGEGSDAGIAWTSTATHGIYIDDNSEKIVVRDNSVGYITGSGILLHNTRTVEVVNNTLFAVREQGISLADGDLSTYNVEASLIENNQVFNLGTQSAGVSAISPMGASFLQGLGTLRNNAYCNPTIDMTARLNYRPGGVTFNNELSLPQWQTLSANDAGSSECSLIYPAYVESGTAGSNLIINDIFAANTDNWVHWPEANGTMARDARMGGSLRFTQLSSTQEVLAYHPIGAVTGGQVYRVRFRGVTDALGTSVGINLQQHGPDYGWLTVPQNVILTATERDIVMYLVPTMNYGSARLNFILQPGSAPIWVDNVEVTTVNAAPLRYEDVARFEVNTTNAARSFTLDQAYTDPRGMLYAAGSTVTLQPYTSIILLRPAPATRRR